MRTSSSLFTLGLIFFIPVAAIYAYFSNFEPVGSVGMLLLGIMSGMVGLYLRATLRKLDESPSDNPDGTIAQGAGSTASSRPTAGGRCSSASRPCSSSSGWRSAGGSSSSASSARCSRSSAGRSSTSGATSSSSPARIEGPGTVRAGPFACAARLQQDPAKSGEQGRVGRVLRNVCTRGSRAGPDGLSSIECTGERMGAQTALFDVPPRVRERVP